MNNHIHIVCLDAPSPPDYGGAIDIFYKIKALHAQGMKIVLHYFDYKKNRNIEGLESHCDEIYAYKRSGFLKSLFRLQPYIVSSRINFKLIQRLRKDDYPLLLEGIHCAGIIPYLEPNRKIIVRVHNNEAAYYRSLYHTSHTFPKKFYYLFESILLNHYQKRKLQAHPTYAFISSWDKICFKEKYHQKQQVFLPCFLPWQTIRSRTGKGNYCLYHGNLSISENRSAALWLAKSVFSQIDFPFIIAGKNANALKNQLPVVPNLKLIENPSDDALSELITDAHINVLPSFNSTGVKLKLLHALFKGRFCVTNEAGIKGSGLHSGVHIATSIAATVQSIKEILSKQFTEEDIQQRTELTQLYNNERNAEKLISLL